MRETDPGNEAAAFSYGVTAGGVKPAPSKPGIPRGGTMGTPISRLFAVSLQPSGTNRRCSQVTAPRL